MTIKPTPKPTLVWLAALTLPVLADTFVMKDGSVLDGTILRQDATSYVVEVQVTKSIKDERVIAKADVSSVKAEKPDEAAFELIAGLVPAPDGLTDEEYAARIRSVEKFLSDYRGSLKTTEAKKILSTLKSEANEILAGAVKLKGKVISPSEYRANAYDVDSRIEAAKINRLIDETQYLAALRAFSVFDRDFRNTSAHQELLPLITRVIRTYIAGIGQSLATFDTRTKERQVGLERMPAADRKITSKAIADEAAAIEKRFAAEKAGKIGWVTTHPFFKPSLEETVAFGKQELARLDKQGPELSLDGGKAYRDALSQIQSGGGNQASITAAIGAAKTAGVPQRYIDELETAAKNGGFAP